MGFYLQFSLNIIYNNETKSNIRHVHFQGIKNYTFHECTKTITIQTQFLALFLSLFSLFAIDCDDDLISGCIRFNQVV